MTTKYATGLVAISFVLAAFSANTAVAANGWAHESEVSVVNTAGNTESESYAGRQRTSLTQDLNVYLLTGRFLLTKTAGKESANAWDAGARYERGLSNLWSVFLGYAAESDRFAGFDMRNSADVGGKYIIINDEQTNFFSELGYRLTRTRFSADRTETDNFGRLYLEYKRTLNDSVNFRFWVEYLPNFSRSNAYLANAEPSLNVMLSEVFSLKMAYLVKYKNEVLPNAKQTDATFTTALVARF